MVRSRRFVTVVVILVLMGTLALPLIALTPNVVSRLAYAAERGQSQAAREQLTLANDLSQGFQYVAKTLRPSVVSISSIKRIQPVVRGHRGPRYPDGISPFFNDDFFDRFFDFQIPEGGLEQRGLGTGLVVSEDGYLLTNNHVVREADEVNVTLSDDREFTAKVVGTDDKTDLAVLKIEASALVPAALGDSESVEVGEWVLAIGSPFGLDQTVTAGIVSAKDRANMGITRYEDFIQTDAAINPGNSGGPLVNLRGEVIGINTAIASRTGGYMGAGFAIPSRIVKDIMGAIIRDGKVERGYIGAGIQELSPELARSFQFDSTEGVLVGQVVPGGPADKAGLQQGDILVEFNGNPTHSVSELLNAVAAAAPNSKTKVVAFRNREKKTLNIVVGRLDDDQLTISRDRGNSSGLGITVQTLTPEIARQLGVDEKDQGVVVTEVNPGSLAAAAGIRPRDMILAVGSSQVRNVADLNEAMSKHDLAEGIRILVNTGGFQRFVFLKSTG